jgi:serine/threonine protein kinase
MSSTNYDLLESSWGGYTSTIYHVPNDTQKVCKKFSGKYADTNFPAEIKAYERFTARGHPSSILKYYGVDENHPASIVLELAANGNFLKYRLDYIQFGHPEPPPETLYRWASQAAEGIAFAHSCNVLHSDIHCVNFFLDENLNLKVADFAGASIDGGKSYSTYRLTHRLFDWDGHDMPSKQITVACEIFAFGSALYTMVTGHDLFPELNDSRDKAEITKLLQKKGFPGTKTLPALGTIIRKCWNLVFVSMNEVEEAIKAECESLESQKDSSLLP